MESGQSVRLAQGHKQGDGGSSSQASAARWALEILQEGAVWWKSYEAELDQTCDRAGQWNYSRCMLEWL